MRLRDLGGLIVVDFIDMEESKNRREVETRLRDALRQDVRVCSQLDLEIRLARTQPSAPAPALSEGSHITCPRCNGTATSATPSRRRCRSCAWSRRSP